MAGRILPRETRLRGTSRRKMTGKAVSGTENEKEPDTGRVSEQTELLEEAKDVIIKRPPYIKSAKAGNRADIKKTGAVPLSLFSMKSLLSFDTILRCQHLPLSDSKICSRAY